MFFWNTIISRWIHHRHLRLSKENQLVVLAAQHKVVREDFERRTTFGFIPLKWSKNRSTRGNSESEQNGEDDDSQLINELPISWNLSSYRSSIVAYIGGYIIRGLMKTISCDTCFLATLTEHKDISMDHDLIVLKDNGGLLYPSPDVLRILKISESVFKTVVCSDGVEIKVKKNLKIQLRNLVLRSLPPVFLSLVCDKDNELVSEDLHSVQVTKEIIDRYFRIRLLRHGQNFTETNIVKDKSGLRPKMTKSLLFQN